MKLTDAQRAEIRVKLDKGAAVSALAAEFKVTKPTIYSILNSSPRSAPSAVSILEREIAAAECQIAELEKAADHIALLRDQVKVRRAALESLKKLEGAK